MLLDHLANAAAYHGLHPRLAAGFAWLAARDWKTVPDGRHDIDGDLLYASVESGTTFEADLRRYESHRRYLDIQYAISGGERMGWWPGAALPVAEQAGPDLWFHRMPPDDGLMIPVPAGHFTIFLPGEAHKPCCHLGGSPGLFRKCVVKVAWRD